MISVLFQFLTTRSLARTALSVLVFTLVLASVSYRMRRIRISIEDPMSSEAEGRNALADYRDVIYFPSRAVRDGVNPYDCSPLPLPSGQPRYMQRYPVLNLFPLYSPLVLVPFWPLTYLDFWPSAILYVAINLLLLVGFAYASLRFADLKPDLAETLGLSALMLATQSGRSNFLGGETAVPLAFGTLAAVSFAKRKGWLSALGLAFTSLKPTFGIPLGVLMLLRRNTIEWFFGWGLGFLIAVAGLGFIFGQSGDLSRFIEVIEENQAELESDPDVNPKTTSARLDSAGAIDRIAPIQSKLTVWIASAFVWGLLGVGLHTLYRRDDPFSRRLSDELILIGVIASIYHLGYDGVLLWAPIVSLAFGARDTEPRFWVSRRIAMLFTAFPMFNVFTSQGVYTMIRGLGVPLDSVRQNVQDLGWTAASVLSGMSLLFAILILVYLAIRIHRSEPSQSES